MREWAWLALRPAIGAELASALTLLEPWTRDASERVRRFAIEATRPRGVWSPHLPELKRTPELGRRLLDAVMEDDARYVQDSVANWLNDAAKSQPAWVQAYCATWTRASGARVAYVTRRALRSLR